MPNQSGRIGIDVHGQQQIRLILSPELTICLAHHHFYASNNETFALDIDVLPELDSLSLIPPVHQVEPSASSGARGGS